MCTFGLPVFPFSFALCILKLCYYIHMHLGLIFPFDNDSVVTRKHITLSLVIVLLNVLIFILLQPV